jgi:hypothetical protein
MQTTTETKQIVASASGEVILQRDILSVLGTVRGATPITFTAKTDARAKKTGNPFALPIRKTSRVNGMINFQYDAGVIRRLEKEGKPLTAFERGESWHELVKDSEGRLTPFCRHKSTGDLYVRFMLIRRLGEPEFEDGEGNPLTAEQAAPFLPKANEYTNQGLDNPLVFLVYKLDSIRSITVSGETFDF